MVTKSNNPKTYQQLSDQLNEILAWFESEEVDLEQAITKYETAQKIINDMEKLLKNSQARVRKLTNGK